MRVIAIMNQQQGVGKTTTALNLAHGLARAGYQVALIDLDPKMSLSRQLKLSQQNEGLAAVMSGKKSLDEVSVLVRDNLAFVAAGQGLAAVEENMGSGIARGYVLDRAVQTSEFSRYDFILLDCASLSGLLAMNALLAAKEVLMPIMPTADAIEKLAEMTKIIKQFIGANLSAPKVWLVMNKSNAANPVILKIKQRIREVFPGRVLTTMLGSYARLEQKTHTGRTLFDYAEQNQSTADFEALANDLVSGRTS